MVSNRNLLFQGSIFRGYVSFREGNCEKGSPWETKHQTVLQETFSQFGGAPCSSASDFEEPFHHIDLFQKTNELMLFLDSDLLNGLWTPTGVENTYIESEYQNSN